MQLRDSNQSYSDLAFMKLRYHNNNNIRKYIKTIII